jgi:hypothetical protein
MVQSTIMSSQFFGSMMYLLRFLGFVLNSWLYTLTILIFPPFFHFAFLSNLCLHLPSILLPYILLLPSSLLASISLLFSLSSSPTYLHCICYFPLILLSSCIVPLPLLFTLSSLFSLSLILSNVCTCYTFSYISNT